MISQSNVDHIHQLEHSIQFGMNMLILIVKRFNHLFKNIEIEKEFDKIPESGENMIEMMKLFPSIKVFCDWIKASLNLLTSCSIFHDIEKWRPITTMFNLINKHSMIYSEKLTELSVKSEFIIKLEEDLELAGFAPLFSLPRNDYDFQNDVKIRLDDIESLNEEIVENINTKKRMEKVMSFAEYLCNLDGFQIKFDSESKRFIQIENPTSENSRENSQGASDRQKAKDDASLDIQAKEYSGSVSKSSENLAEGNNEINELMEKHRMLKERIEEHEKIKQKNLSIINKTILTRIEIEVRPRFIIPDTNCFVDHLNLIDKILNSSHYVIMIPLLVVNEIDKLTKMNVNLSEYSPEHADYVQKSARNAMTYLNQKFEKKTQYLRAMTSQGSTLDTIKFRSEEVIAKVVK